MELSFSISTEFGTESFRVRAYENGARIVELLEEDLETLIKEERLGKIKGIGKTLQQNIQELVTTGKLAYYEELKGEFPETLFELFKFIAIPYVGEERRPGTDGFSSHFKSIGRGGGQMGCGGTGSTIPWQNLQ